MYTHADGRYSHEKTMSDFYPTPAHSDLADSREGERARSAHPHERTRDPLIDHPRPALPRCTCRLPPLPHRCCHTVSATWVRLGRYYADDATLLLPATATTPPS